MPGFDFGNSPSQLNQAQLAGRPVVFSTVGGVRGLQRFRQARALCAAGPVSARAPTRIWPAPTTSKRCCSGNVSRPPRSRAASARRISVSVSRPAFSPHLPQADLDIAADIDRYDFALPVRREGELLVIRRTA